MARNNFNNDGFVSIDTTEQHPMIIGIPAPTSACELLCRKGEHEGKTFSLYGESAIGRRPTHTIYLTDPYVSRDHCILRCDSPYSADAKWSVVCLGLNGFFLDGVHFRPSPDHFHPLKVGSILQIKDSVFEVIRIGRW